MILQGQNIILTPVVPEDIPLLLSWLNDIRNCHLYDECPFFSTREVKETMLNDPKEHHFENYLIRSRENTPLGYIFFRNIDEKIRQAEILVRLSSTHKSGSVYGLDAIMTLSIYGFFAKKLERIYAQMVEYSFESKRLAEFIGMRMEAELKEDIWSDGRYWSMFIYGLLKEEFIAFLKRPSTRRFLKEFPQEIRQNICKAAGVAV